jgi:hypothetical protein
MTGDSAAKSVAASGGPPAASHRALHAALEALEAGRQEEARAMLAPLVAPLMEPGRAYELADHQPLVTLAEGYNASLDWAGGHLVYQVLVAAGHAGFVDRRDWLAKRVAVQEQFLAHFEGETSLARLGQVLGPRLGGQVRGIKTTRMRPGMVAMALYRHEVTLEGRSSPVVVVEKTFRDRKADIEKLTLQDLLFTTVPPQRLFAPAYYGMLRGGSFGSSFHAMVPGESLPPSRWERTWRELMYYYWSEAPHPRLAAGKKLMRQVMSDLRHVAAGGLRPAMRAHLSDRLRGDGAASAAAARMAAIEAAVAPLPLFVLHDDLHAGNILVDEQGSLSVIDWDRWWLAPIGAGWPVPFTPEDGEAMSLDRITWARPLPAGVGTSQMMLAAALWAWQLATRHEHPKDAARYLERALTWEG